MTLFLNPRFWLTLGLALALTLSHLFVYRAGRAMLGKEIANERLETAKASLRKTEILADKKDAALLESSKRAIANAADARAARDAVDGLQSELAAQRAWAADSLSTCTKSAAATRDVFQQCTARYTDLAEKADRHANDALTCYQAWPK